ncbi:phage protein Gp36 family protein [Desulfovibrio sp.]|uniref:phage protein Gp36 family protein n=1 Tax=Desulfovibrio sp. TaxID=885 RepID=UPI003D101CF0
MYATVADMQARYGAQLVALAGTTADKQVDLAAVERALTAACAEIDVVLSVRYAVPISITPVPPVLRRIAEDLAASALPRNGASEASMYERRAREARDLLDKLAAGKAALGAGASPAQPSGQSTKGGIAYHAPSSDFRRKLEDL